MKKLAKIVALIVLTFTPSAQMTAQTETAKVHKVVFDVTADGADKWLGALQNVENAKKSLGSTSVRFELEAHCTWKGSWNACREKCQGEFGDSVSGRGQVLHLNIF